MTSRVALLLTFLSAAGCGMVQVQTSSSLNQTGETDPSADPPAASTSAPNASAAATAAPPEDATPEDLGEVALGDLKSAISRMYKGKRDRLIKLTSPTRRTIRIFTLHGVLVGVRNNKGERAGGWNPKEIVVDKEVVLELNTSQNAIQRYPDEEYGIVVYDPKVTEFTTKDIYGLPPVDAPIERKALDDYAPWWDRGYFPRNDVALADAAAWLEKVDERFFMFTTAERCNLLEDEPVIILKYSPISYGYEIDILRLNGDELNCREQSDRPALFTNSRPAKIVLPAPGKPKLEPLPTIWSEEPFLEDASTKPEVAKYAANKEKAHQCSNKQWDRLDPDHRAGRYDVVTRDASGNITGAESLSKRLGRQVDAACKINALWTERGKLFEKWRADYEALSKATIIATGKRLGATADAIATPKPGAKSGGTSPGGI